MKMETSIVANQDGVIDKIYVKEGEQVNRAICWFPSYRRADIFQSV